MFKVYPFCGWNVTDQEVMLSEVIAVNKSAVSSFWPAVRGSPMKNSTPQDARIWSMVGIKFCHNVTNLATSYCKKTHRLEGGLLVKSTMEILI